MTSEAEDKRRYLRVPVKVDFRVDDGSAAEIGELYFSSRNVSIGGAFLASDILLDYGTDISVRFQLPGEALIEARARVVWVNDQEDTDWGMGIEFTLISPANLEAIRRYGERTAAAG